MLPIFDHVFSSWPHEARRRLTALAVTGFLVSFGLSSVDVIMPLWATRDLHMTAANWANVRSLRFAGVLLGVILLGAMSDRFGQRRSAIGMLLILGGVTALFALNSQIILWILMPLFGALVSTVLVNFNTLTQLVSTSRQGVANTVYRSVGAAAGIASPVVATTLAAAWGGYPPVFLVLGPMLALAGWTLLAYPIHEPLTPLAHPVVEIKRSVQGYTDTWREKPLMRFIHLSSLWNSAMACVSAFAAIRLTRELEMDDGSFGWLVTVIGAFTLSLLAVTGRFLDRLSLRRFHVAVGSAGAIGTLVMGCSNSLVLTGIGFGISASLVTLLIGPSSMWVSRNAGSATQGDAFAMQKVIIALYLSSAMFLFGILERWVGIRISLLLGGGASLLLAIAFLLLPEPLRPGTKPGDSMS